MSSTASDFADYETLTLGLESKGYSISCTPDGITKAGNKKYVLVAKNIDGEEVFKSIAFDKLDRRGITRRSVLMENQLKEHSPKAVASTLKQFETLI